MRPDKARAASGELPCRRLRKSNCREPVRIYRRMLRRWSAKALRWLAEFASGKPMEIALAPYHLQQEPELIASLIRDLEGKLAVFYAWQHGMGCMQAQPKEKELLQMPGRGPLDFGPIVNALKDTRFQGWTSIFMHPFPRGIPILESTEDVTQEINRARAYLKGLL